MPKPQALNRSTNPAHGRASIGEPKFACVSPSSVRHASEMDALA